MRQHENYGGLMMGFKKGLQIQVIGYSALTLNLFVTKICGLVLWGLWFLLRALELSSGHWVVGFATRDIAMALGFIFGGKSFDLHAKGVNDLHPREV